MPDSRDDDRGLRPPPEPDPHRETLSFFERIRREAEAPESPDPEPARETRWVPPPRAETEATGEVAVTASGNPTIALPRGHDGRLPTIPGYESIEELGRGGMGVVYKARQVGLDRIVALKMISRPDLAAEEERRRFHLEGQAIARLRHLGIVQI